MRRRAIAAALAAWLAGRSSALAASDPTSACQANKLRWVAQKASGLLRCHGAAAATGGVVDDACLAGHADVFDGRFAVTDARGGCVQTGDAAAVEQVVDAAVAEIAATLRPSLQASGCASTTLYATGGAAYRVLTAFAKQRKKANEARFAKLALGFPDDLAKRFTLVQASSADCASGADAAAVAARVLTLAGDLVLRLWPASRSGLRFTPPAGFTLNANLFAMTDGRTVGFTHRRSAGIVPEGGADITISRLPLPSGSLASFIASRRMGREVVSTTYRTIAGETGTAVRYRETYDRGITYEAVVVYVTHGSDLYQLALTYGSGDAAEASVLSSFDALLASTAFGG
jgi:hypothetical protein